MWNRSNQFLTSVADLLASEISSNFDDALFVEARRLDILAELGVVVVNNVSVVQVDEYRLFVDGYRGVPVEIPIFTGDEIGYLGRLGRSSQSLRGGEASTGSQSTRCSC